MPDTCVLVFSHIRQVRQILAHVSGCRMMSFIYFLCYCVAKNQLKFILSS